MEQVSNLEESLTSKEEEISALKDKNILLVSRGNEVVSQTTVTFRWVTFSEKSLKYFDGDLTAKGHLKTV